VQKALLHLQISKSMGQHYGIPIDLKNTFSPTFDLDNFSDSDVVNMAIHFLETPNLHIIIEAEKDAPFHKISTLLNALRDLENKSIEFKGEHKIKNYLGI
jgi:biopolymer transport protein ExbD